ncbi:MAG: hypothetical protein HYZ26_08580 [Chloroflexi bacterium]|nr:hypothetical protein [Chloroflexota bacterium]
MKTYTNDALIKRNRRVGMISAFLAPVLMFVGAQISLSGRVGQLVSVGLILFAFVLFLVGIALRRYGQGAEVRLAEGLRKLDGNYALFNFTSPAAHLLAGPAGIWILVPRYVRGTLAYDERRRRWRVRRNRLADRLLGPLFGGIGRPDYDLAADADALDRYLQKHWNREAQPHVDAAIVVVNEDGSVDAENAHIPTLHVSKLRAYLRDHEKGARMSPQEIRHFISLLVDST